MNLKKATVLLTAVASLSSALAADAVVHNLRGENPVENYFRKSVRLDARPRRAVVRIYSDTEYELFVNGRLAAVLREWGNVRDYELTPFFRTGDNLIAVRAANYSGHRGFAFELVADGRQVAVSDGSWRTYPEERWGWMLPGFDEADWHSPQVMDLSAAGGPQWKGRAGDGSAKVIPTLETCPFFTGDIPKGLDSPFYGVHPPAAAQLPEGLLAVTGPAYAESITRPLPTVHTRAEILRLTPGTGTAERDGKSIRLTAPDRWTGPSFVIDLGEQVVGHFRLRLRSEGPVAFRTRQAESLSEVLTEPNPREPLHRMLCHEYRLEKGVQEFESRDRMGGRFVHVEFFDTPKLVTADGFSLRWTLYPVRRTGYFRCDDALLNDAWQAAERTLHLNMQEFYLDAVKRDRMLWVGDARAEQLANYAFFGDTDLFEFCWRKMAECQFASGAMPSSFGEGLSVIWDFNAWYVIALDEYVEWTGRTEFPVSLAENVRRVTDWMVGKAGQDGLIALPENPIRPLWMVALNGGRGQDTFMNVLFQKMLMAASRICAAAGQDAAARRYADHARRIDGAVRQLHAEHPLSSFKPNLFSPQMFYFTLDHQADSGDLPGACARLKAALAEMLSSGSGTLTENMPAKGPVPSVTDPQADLGAGSLCHGWQALLAPFVVRNIVGVTALEPGWRKVRIAPRPCGLGRFVSAVPTPKGPVAVSFDGKAYDIWLPEGVTGEFVTDGVSRKLVSGRNRP